MLTLIKNTYKIKTMPDQMSAEIVKPVGPTNIADIRRSLGIPEGSSAVDLHDKVVGRIVNRDCLDTLPDLWEAVNNKVPDLSLLPISLSTALSASAAKAGSLELLNSQNPGFSFEEAAVIAEESVKNAQSFEQIGDRVRATEARRIPTVFVETMVLTKLMGGWGAEPVNGKTVGAWRRDYIKGGADDLNDYTEYVKAVDTTDATAAAEKVIQAHGNLQRLGISSYAQLFEIVGMNKEALAKQAEGAVGDFQEMKGALDSKIQDLVTQGRIPDNENVKKSYAAYALAANELDKEVKGEVSAHPEEIFSEMARKEGIAVPQGSYKIYTNSERANAAAVMLAWVDESGKRETGIALLLPPNAQRRQVYHEGAHGLQADITPVCI